MMVRVLAPSPGAAIEVGENAAVTPAGAPVTDKAIADLNAATCARVTATWPAVPCTTVMLDDDRLKVKLGAWLIVTGRTNVGDCPPPVPVTAMM